MSVLSLKVDCRVCPQRNNFRSRCHQSLLSGGCSFCMHQQKRPIGRIDVQRNLAKTDGVLSRWPFVKKWGTQGPSSLCYLSTHRAVYVPSSGIVLSTLCSLALCNVCRKYLDMIDTVCFLTVYDEMPVYSVVAGANTPVQAIYSLVC